MIYQALQYLAMFFIAVLVPGGGVAVVTYLIAKKVKGKRNEEQKEKSEVAEKLPRDQRPLP